jgi:hypothetical protein
MSRISFALVVSSLLVAVVGCGGSDDARSKADVSKPDSLLLSTSELPDGTTTGEAPPELCGPLPVFEKNGGQTAISKMFGVGAATVVEAVGVFDTPAKAKLAFAGLNDRERLECIRGAAITLGLASSVEITKLQALDIGDDDAVVRYASFDGSEGDAGGGSEPNAYSDVVAMRIGRCTAALLVAVESSDPPDAVSEETMEAVGGRLSGACG